MLPELRSTAANGGKRTWKVYVSGSQYTVEHGVVGGKMVTATRECHGKNIGRANETTPHEQALAEAKSKWNKKIDEGYVAVDGGTRISGASADRGASVTLRRHPVLPMLAQKYDPSKMTFPCSIQPKLDGVRAMYYGGALWSRLGKMLPEVDVITDQLSDVRAILDGELYCHDMTFQEIISAVKKRNANTPRLVYVVYDTVGDEGFPERFERVSYLLSTRDRPNVQVLETYRCETEKSVASFMERFLADKYEGAMLRSDAGGYTMKFRSKTLQKYKEFTDAEFTITGYTEGEGTEKGLVLFTCVCDGGEFSVRPMGTRETRREMFVRGETFLGKKLTVKYQELTDSGIPRFPVGVAVRDYE